MADLNSVTLIGRLTKDADLKSTAGGHSVSRFAIAVNRSVKKGDGWESEAGFFDVTLWGRRAESLSQYLAKGKTVGVSGELRQERWQQDGQSRSRVVVAASAVQQLGGSKPDGESGGGWGDPDF